MRSETFPLFGPLAESRKRRKALERERMRLDEVAEPEEHARLTGLIQFERDFENSFASFMKERAGQRRAVTAKGLLQLLAMTVVIFLLIGLARRWFG